MPRRFAVSVFGQLEVLHSKWSARVQGDMWVSQRRDPLGANPRTGFRQVQLTPRLDAGTRNTAVVRGWV